MKNTHIKNLLSVVPDTIRLEVYKEALANVEKGYGLCLLLPTKLWDIHYLDDGPDGLDWDFDDTKIAFPELTVEVINTIQRRRASEDIISTREKYLKLWIEQLEQTLNKNKNL
jgi:hypothetical protein